MQSMKILEGDGVLLAQPLLIEQFGRAGAQFLSQLHYWLNHNQNIGTMSNGAKWIYNSAKDWAEQLRLSSRTVQRLISSLKNSGVLEIKKLSANKHNRTNHYTINYEALEKLISYNSKILETSEKLITTKCRNAFGQSDAMYIQRLPNKELNKSEKQSLEITNEKSCSKDSFKQVKNLKNIVEKSRVGHQEIEYSDVNKSEEIIFDTQDLDTNYKTNTSKTNTAQTMLKIWNETLGAKAEAFMNKELAPLLVSGFSKKFEKNLSQWKRYCSLINSSAYLMGESFQLSIFWALKFSTIDRIRAGEFGVKGELFETKQDRGIKSLEEVSLEINQIKDESLNAKELRKKILQVVGIGHYISWFQHAKICEQNDRLSLIAPNSFVAQTWELHFDWVIKINHC
jgi:hypothetical protein